MRKYKIVCSDLDGTLLDDHSMISRENLEAIQQMTAWGVFFVPSTGRSFSELPTVLKDDPAIRFFICSNGAAVVDRETGEDLLTCISEETTGKIMEILDDYEVHTSLRQDGICYVDAALANEEAFEYHHVYHAHRVVVKKFAVLREDFGDFCRRADHVEMITAFFRNAQELVQGRERILALGGLRIVGVTENNLEIINADAGKGSALRSLADLLGIDREDTIAVGDSDNDRSMIRAAGLGLAVSNACDALKDAAQELICSNNEHSAAYILTHYL